MRALGRTPLRVSEVGLGAGTLGDPAFSEAEAERLLLGALDLGVNLVDTAPSYGISEERIGRILGSRRKDVVLSTKGGYGVAGVPDWTGEVISAGIEQALRRLRTDVLDLFHLHSCPLEVLRREDILEALERAVAAGKIRAAAYSGENEALSFAIDSGRFAVVQTSVNFCDQRGLEGLVPEAAARGIGVLGKRALASAVWRDDRPGDEASRAYRHRLEVMKLDPAPFAWDELAIRFAAHAPGVTAILVGTRSLERLARAVELAAAGPLPEARLDAMRARFRSCDAGWVGQV
ncbi:MAG TPA: aldo/keto reductase [Candidatus Polarisedimenticolaceae bacterium]|nr:aldo/keto reductase [Candidatus Polarisedimenticolaceae bacterium]